MIDPNTRCFRCMGELPEAGAPCPECGAVPGAFHNNASQLPVGTILAGKYLVGSALGQGGFGITYVAWDLNLNRKMAVKEYFPDGLVGRDTVTRRGVLSLPGAPGETFRRDRDRFAEEGKLLARFAEDPGIVGIHNFFFENGTAYLVMDFIRGRTLKELAGSRGGKLPASQALRFLLPLTDSLARVHRAGLLHRDIAPDNIMLEEDGHAVLIDFGAARQISVDGEHTNTVAVKAGFAPEEQYRPNGEQGPWTDVYALCATLYKLTTGITPPQATDRLITGLALTPPNRAGADFTPGEEAAVMKGLSVQRGDRQQSMEKLKRDLLKKGTPKKGKRLWPVIAGAAALAIGLGAFVLLEKPGQQEAAAVPEAEPTAAQAPMATSAPTPASTPVPTPTPEPEPLTEGENYRDNFKITVENGTGTLTGYTGEETRVTIPGTYLGTPIVKIGESAFAGNGTITEVTISEGITSIGRNAFCGCAALAKLTLPEGLTVIKDSAFADCGALTELALPEGLTEIAQYAFSKTGVASVSFPSTLLSIGFNSFYGCLGLTEITLPEGFTTLGENAFFACENLGKVYIPDSLKSFGSNAFFKKEGGTMVIICNPGSPGERYAKKEGIPYMAPGEEPVDGVVLSKAEGYLYDVDLAAGTVTIQSDTGGTSLFFLDGNTDFASREADLRLGRKVIVEYPAVDEAGTYPPAQSASTWYGPVTRYYAIACKPTEKTLKERSASGMTTNLGGELCIGDIMTGKHYALHSATQIDGVLPEVYGEFQAKIVYVAYPTGEEVAVKVVIR